MELENRLTGLRAHIGQLMPLIRRYQYVWVVLLAGILLLAAGGGTRDAPAAPESDGQKPAADSFDLAAFEARLQDSLSQIQGAGAVKLMLSLEESGQTVYASNVRHSQGEGANGSYERSLSTVSDGSYGEQPVQIEQHCPTFRGAVVLCQGAESDQVRLAVTQAVSAVCGLGADRISVIQMCR